MWYIEKAIYKLKNNWYKITKARKIILDILAGNGCPISAYEIIDFDNSLDKATIYRFLEILESLHLVKKIYSLNKYVRTDWECYEHNHYFLVCRECFWYEEKVVDKIDRVFWNLGIFPNNHCLELVGLCKNCWNV